MRGYSLIELMIVVAIIGILATMAAPAYSNYICKAKETEVKTALAHLHQMQVAHRARYDIYAHVTENTCPRGWARKNRCISFDQKGESRFIFSGRGNRNGYRVYARGDRRTDMKGALWTVDQSGKATAVRSSCGR